MGLGLGGAATYRGVVSSGGCFQSFGKLLSQVGRGSLDPRIFVPLGSLSALGAGDSKMLCKCIMMSLGVAT